MRWRRRNDVGNVSKEKNVMRKVLIKVTSLPSVRSITESNLNKMLGVKRGAQLGVCLASC